MRTVLLGMGNPILRDDAVGIRLAHDFKRRYGALADLDVIAECSVGGLNLLGLIDGYDQMIAVDSIKTRGGIAGSWYRFTLADLRETMHLSNIHDANFATAVELGRRLGMAVPAAPSCHVFAVEILDNLTFDETMSEILELAYPALAAEILPEILELVGVAPIAPRPFSLEQSADWNRVLRPRCDEHDEHDEHDEQL
jgi:hydrogenase maturation protease